MTREKPSTPASERERKPRFSKAAEKNRRLYEKWMFVESVLAPQGRYMEGSLFANYGYWEADTVSAREACENLMDRLMDLMPHRQGKVLDVACGLGATSRHLARQFGAENITGINISPKQLEVCRETSPGSHFLEMDATRLEFPDATFDHVVCVEAAFHFEPRRRFFEEVLRVLKPGGSLVLSDILHDLWGEKLNPLLHPKNHLADPGAYTRLLEEVGFTGARTEDVTIECWNRSNLRLLRFVCDEYKQGRIDRKNLDQIMIARLLRIMTTRYYLVAGGIKPNGTQTQPGGLEAETTP
jgi:cyclopropane fatty-acyl-phospholipid synthase-like methyltransferase